MYIDKTKGKVYNIGGGMENSFSLLELFKALEDQLDIKMTYIENMTGEVLIRKSLLQKLINIRVY